MHILLVYFGGGSFALFWYTLLGCVCRRFCGVLPYLVEYVSVFLAGGVVLVVISEGLQTPPELVQQSVKWALC